MRLWIAKYGLLLWLALLLCAGFVSTTLFGYIAARDSLRQGLTEQTLPITGDTVYSEIQKDVLRPVFVSAHMAQDTFLRDWMLNGEQESEAITKYLREILVKNQAISSFLVSEATHRYYHANGVLKTISESEPRDRWFFRTRSMSAPYEINVDLDAANHDHLTVFINHRVLDYAGHFLGTTGIGLTLDTVRTLIDRYQHRFHRSIYFVDSRGRIVLSGHPRKQAGLTLDALPGMAALAPRILTSRAGASLHMEYQTEQENVLLNARFIPELGWHLIVEQDISEDMRPLQHTLWLNLSIAAIITVLVLCLTLLSVRRFQKRLEKTASTDALTSLLNRHAFDFIYEQAVLDSERTRQPMCAVLVDVDLFKEVNDRHGHLVGDHVLREIAQIARRSLRESDVLCRWGGEEFLILLKNCTLEKATSIAENLRQTIAGNDFSRTTKLLRQKLSVTVSMGVAPCRDQESEDSVFERADMALYQAKQNGRNSVYFSE